MPYRIPDVKFLPLTPHQQFKAIMLTFKICVASILITWHTCFWLLNVHVNPELIIRYWVCLLDFTVLWSWLMARQLFLLVRLLQPRIIINPLYQIGVCVAVGLGFWCLMNLLENSDFRLTQTRLVFGIGMCIVGLPGMLGLCWHIRRIKIIGESP